MNRFTGMNSVEIHRTRLPIWKKLLGCFFLLLVAAFLAACQQGTDTVESGPVEALTIAHVNGRPVLREQFEAFLALSPDQREPELDSYLRLLRFREFLTEQLLLQEAETAEVTVEPDELQHQLEQWLSGGEEADDALRDRVHTWVRIQKFIKQEVGAGIEVTNQQMYNYYQAHSDDFRISDRAHVLELLVDERVLAEDLRRRVPEGDVRVFQQLARENSIGLTADLGGDLGIFERGELPENFEDVIFKLRPGEASEIFHSSQGYHIFMIEEWVPRHARRFYEVQQEIFEQLMARQERVALEEYVQNLFEVSSIEVRDESLRQWREVNSGVW